MSCERHPKRYTKEPIVFQVGLLLNTLFHVLLYSRQLSKSALSQTTRKIARTMKYEDKRRSSGASRVLGRHPPFPHSLIST